MFCYYFAIYRKKKDKDYSVSDWNNVKKVKDIATFTNKYGITSMVSNVNNDPAFRSRVDKVSEFLANRKNFWARALESQMNAIFSSKVKFKSSGSYFIMRADMIPKNYDPYQGYEQLSRLVRGKLGFRGTIDKDKWNPSDVWVFTNESKKN